jgi:hypothetical protein
MTGEIFAIAISPCEAKRMHYLVVACPNHGCAWLDHGVPWKCPKIKRCEIGIPKSLVDR